MPSPDDADCQPLWKRLAWMALFWSLGLGAVGLVAVVIRYWLGV